MRHNIKISVIIPVYNVEKYIRKCIESILDQTYTNIDIILVNDGSIDSSGLICDEYAVRDNRISVIHKHNGGVSAARNIGIEIAKGDYICFVDSDDWIEKEYFESVIKYLIKYKPALLINNYLYDYDDGNVVNYFSNTRMLVMDKNRALIEMVKTSAFGWEPFASFYEADQLKRCYFDKHIKFGEDLLFNYSFINRSKGVLLYVPIAKYHYMYRSSSACNSYSLIKKMDDIKVMEYIMERESGTVGEIIFYKEYIPRIIQRIKLATYSRNIEDLKVGQSLKRCLRKCWCKILMNSNINKSIKVKVFIFILPNFIIKFLNEIYCKLKRMLVLS